MATYTKVYNNPYPDGWKDGKDGKTPVTADILNNQTETLESIEQYLADNPIEQGGGSSGTTDYEALDNKPTINGVEVVGDLSLEDLGITGGGGSGTTNYEDLTNKPSINGIDLQGNLTVEELGLLDITESTDTTLENSKDGILKIKDIYGNTEQDTTSGSQLFDYAGLIQGAISSETGQETADPNTKRTDYTSCEAETSYTISNMNGSKRALYFDENKTMLSSFLFTPPVNTFTTPASCSYFVVQGANSLWNENVMLNKGTTALPFEKYTGGMASPNPNYPQEPKSVVLSEIKTTNSDGSLESVATLSNPITMNGLNGVWDTLESKKFKTVVFDGSESGWSSSSNVSGRFLISIPYVKLNTLNAMCTQATVRAYSASFVKNTFFISGAGSFGIDTEFATLDEWKAHLASKPMTVVFELSEPIETPLPDADVEALKSLKTYDGVTHIFTDSEVEPSLLFEYNTTRVGTELDEIDAELVKINKRITDIGTTAQINYSTEEQVIGTWIDGKPLYQKTVELTAPDVAYTYKTIPHNIPDVEDIFIDEAHSRIIDANGSRIPVNSSRPGSGTSNNNAYSSWSVPTTSGISMVVGEAITNSRATFTIQYTKTTDTV